MDLIKVRTKFCLFDVTSINTPYFFQIYKDVLEKQENFNHFSDFLETFSLTKGKVDDDREREFAGEFKVSSYCSHGFLKSLGLLL